MAEMDSIIEATANPGRAKVAKPTEGVVVVDRSQQGVRKKRKFVSPLSEPNEKHDPKKIAEEIERGEGTR